MHSPGGIACTITILTSGVVEIRGFLADDVTVTLERVVMRKSSIRSSCRDALIGKSHKVLRLSPELRQSPGSFPLSDVETLGYLLIEPSKELHVTGAITSVRTLEPLDLDFVLNALHLLDDRRSEGITVVC
jgi:hypothetical protein